MITKLWLNVLTEFRDVRCGGTEPELPMSHSLKSKSKLKSLSKVCGSLFQVYIACSFQGLKTIRRPRG